jgi:thiol:disulfide interchange protein DsbA
VEVFSYHSVHCFNFEPMLQAWKKQQADDVVIVQNHAVWNAPMEISAQAFYTAKVLKIDDTTHAAIFNAIHLEREILSSAEQWVDFLSSFGVERETLAKTFDSLDVKSRVSQASARARSYGITGAPEMVVNGKYRISTREAGSNTEMLKIVDFLVGRERNSASTDERSAAISNSKYMLSEDAKWYQ